MGRWWLVLILTEVGLHDCCELTRTYLKLASEPSPDFSLWQFRHFRPKLSCLKQFWSDLIYEQIEIGAGVCFRVGVDCQLNSLLTLLVFRLSSPTTDGIEGYWYRVSSFPRDLCWLKPCRPMGRDWRTVFALRQRRILRSSVLPCQRKPCKLKPFFQEYNLWVCIELSGNGFTNLSHGFSWWLKGHSFQKAPIRRRASIWVP